MRKKRRLRTWVLYAIFTILLAIMILLLDKFQLIQPIDNSSLDMSRACILLVVYECLRRNIKTILNREKEKE